MQFWASWWEWEYHDALKTPIVSWAWAIRSIDAPERGQPFSDRAKRELSTLVFGRQPQYLNPDIIA